MEPIHMNAEHPGLYYSVFYTLAVVVAFVLLTWEGRKRDFPLLPWWLMVATSFLLFIVGTQFIKFGYAEWRSFFHFETLATPTGRSVLGGLVLGTIGLTLAKQLLRFPYRVVDTFALVIPLGLAIQRIGCFMAGCCFGTCTAVPWAIQYTSSSPVYSFQRIAQQIPTNAVYTLPVHPVQLYDLLSCLLILCVLVRVKSRLKNPGSLLAVSLLLYGTCRFFLEFVRAESKGSLFFLNYTQVALVFILPVLTLWVIRNERKRARGSDQPYNRLTPLQHYTCLLGLIGLFVLFSKWLNPLEVLTMTILILPTLGLAVWEVFKATTLPSFRGATLMLILVALITMNQTYPEYAASDSTRLRYNTVSLGFAGGSADYSYYYTDCNSNTYTLNHNNSYSAGAAGFSRTIQQSKYSSLNFGINGFVGSHTERTDSTRNNGNTRTLTQNYNLYGVNPYVQYNWKYGGLGFGYYFGNLTSIQADPSQIKLFHISPSYSVRLGNLRTFFMEYRYASNFPSPFPAQTNQLSVGSSFGSRRGGLLRIGTSSGTGFFIAPTIPIGKHVILETIFGGGGNLFTTSDQHPSSSYLGMNLHYKFGITELPLVKK